MTSLTRRFRYKYEFRSWVGLIKILAFNRTRRLGVYVGYVGHGNLGDEALFEAIRLLFSKQLTLLCPRRLERFYWRLLPKSRVDIILLGGGTLIKKVHPYLGRMTTLQSRFPTARVVVFGTGVSDAKLWSSFGVDTDVEGWVQFLSECDFVGVRGPLSREFLSEWGVARSVEVIGDPAVCFLRSPSSGQIGDRRIGLNFGPSLGRIFGGDENAVLEFAAQLIRRLVADGWRLTAFPMTADDAVYLGNAIDMSGCSEVGMFPAFLDLEATLQALGRQDVFLGEKLHSVVLANCSLTPAVMLAYRTKCFDYMLSTGQGDLTLRTDALDLARTLKMIEDLYADREAHQALLLKTLGDQKRQLTHTAERLIKELLGDVG